MQQTINFFNPWHIGKYDVDKIPQSIRKYITIPFYVFLSAFIMGNTLFIALIITEYVIPENAKYVLYTGYIFMLAATVIHIAL